MLYLAPDSNISLWVNWSISFCAQIKISSILVWAQNEIDQLTQREILESGAKYSIWGDVKLVTSRIVDVDTVYAFSTPEFVGRMPILQDLTVKLMTIYLLKNRILELGFYRLEP